MASVLGILYVLDIFPDQELKKTIGQMAAIVGIISFAGTIMTLINRSPSQGGK